jgi:hypothetical protein
MKRKGLLFLVLATLIAGGAFAQKVGDTVDVMGQKYDVKEAKDGRLVLQLAATLDGTWAAGDYIVFTITGNTSVIKKLPTSGGLTKSAVDKGHVKYGSTAWYKNITKKSDRTWSAQLITILWKTNDPNVATGLNYIPVTLTLSADGKTLTDNSDNTFTRQ